MPFPIAALLPSILGAAGTVFQTIAGNRSARREYDKMRDYNTPKAQMQRFSEAGLSPYLAYGQASSGNVSAPRPAQEYPTEAIGNASGNALANYMSFANFDIDNKNKWMQYWNSQYKNQQEFYNVDIRELEKDKRMLELYSDYPDFMEKAITPSVVGSGYRRKMNELKMAASKALVDRTNQTVQNLQYKNVVDRVKAKYASDYGMVGGDWTQGLGMLKSLPSLFRGSRKVVGKTPSAIPGKSFNQSRRDFEETTRRFKNFKF